MSNDCGTENIGQVKAGVSTDNAVAVEAADCNSFERNIAIVPNSSNDDGNQTSTPSITQPPVSGTCEVPMGGTLEGDDVQLMNANVDSTHYFEKPDSSSIASEIPELARAKEWLHQHMQQVEQNEAQQKQHLEQNGDQQKQQQEQNEAQQNLFPHSESPPPTLSTSKKDQWNLMLNHLIAYKAEHNNTSVPKRYRENGLGNKGNLGIWVETQRAQFKKMWMAAGHSDELLATSPDPTIYITPNLRLCAERLRRLQDIGFVWFVRRRKGTGKNPAMRKAWGLTNYQKPYTKKLSRKKRNEDQWNEMYERLVQYKDKNGDCVVPKGFPGDPKLACWVETQRHQFSKYYAQNADGEQLFNQTKNLTAVSQTATTVPATTIATSQTTNAIPNLQVTDQNQVEDQKMHAPEDDQSTPLGSDTTEAVLKSIQDAVTAAAESRDHTQVLQNSAVIDTEFGTGAMNDHEGNDLWLAGNQLDVQNSADTSDGKEGSNLDGQKCRLTVDRKRKLEDIGFVWSVRNKKNAEYWELMYSTLLQYKANNGNCLVPSRFSANTRLAKWVESIRSEYAKLTTVVDPDTGLTNVVPSIKLPAERIKRLEDAGFEWRATKRQKLEPGPDAVKNDNSIESQMLPPALSKLKHTARKVNYRKQWESMFDCLKQYKDTFGHVRVPKRYKENPALGVWVDTQRVQYKKLQQKIESGDTNATSNRLTEDRMQRLNSIGFVWSIRHDWHKHYKELTEFKSSHGHCNVPARYAPNNRLGIFVTAQRQQYRLLNKVKSGAVGPRAIPLTEDKMKLLEKIGFEWTLRTADSKWKQRVKELRQFKQKHGTECRVPSRYKGDTRLGYFCKTQREDRARYDQGKPSKLNPDKIAELDSIGFSWDISDKFHEGSVEEQPGLQENLNATDVGEAYTVQPEGNSALVPNGISEEDQAYVGILPSNEQGHAESENPIELIGISGAVAEI